MAAHSFMPEAPDRAHAPASLPPSTHVPKANPRAAGEQAPAGAKHAFLPEARQEPEQTLRERHASLSPQGSAEETVLAKGAYAAPEPKQAGLRNSLTKLAHRWGTHRYYLDCSSVHLAPIELPAVYLMSGLPNQTSLGNV